SFATAFCLKMAESGDQAPSALSIHFGDEFLAPTLKLERRHRRPSRFGVRYDIPFSKLGHSSTAGTLSYLLFRGGYLSAGQVLHVVRNLINEKRKEQIPIRRASVADAGNIVPDFPGLKADPVFISALADLLSSDGITTVLLYSIPEHGAEDYVIDQ